MPLTPPNNCSSEASNPTLPQPCRPLLSCLMITLDRLALAKRAIRSYAAQTYANRELVIVTDGKPSFCAALQSFVEEEQVQNVRFVHVAQEGLSLGTLRNISWDAAHGDIVCQWDDDDLSHPDRLTLQADYMFKRNARACFFADHLQYLEDSHMLCWVDWTKGGSSEGPSRMAPGTGMIYRDVQCRYPETGPKARQSEDSVLLWCLYDSVPIAEFANHGYLYLYTYHGRNTFSREHHYKLTNCRSPNAWLTETEDKLREALTHYDIPKPVLVIGQQGLAFSVH